MSLYDYQVSKEIVCDDHPFYALIMAAMRKADDVNLEKLRKAFPFVYNELMSRYNAPGGRLENDR